MPEKMNNKILNIAKHSNDTDEWYTTYETVEEELKHYASQLKDKIILCNCDDPVESAFSKYFLNNFANLKIKKLICTSYDKSQIEWNKKVRKKSFALIVDSSIYKKNNGEVEKIIKDQNAYQKLNGDGDFRSPECVEFLKQSDIVITNPPFSLFRELFVLINKHKKKYLLICNQNAITYKEVFPYIKNNKARIGYKFGDMEFKVPNWTEPRKTRYRQDETGQKWRSIGNAMWLTNLKTSRKNESLNLVDNYSPDKYPKFDNYDAINVSRVINIPKDYSGIMAVPLTYLKYHDHRKFEIVGEANHGSDNEYDLFKPIINGKEQFKKILIKNKELNKDGI